jgi:precorrin-2 dehydrogenase / sirohydrochlorin ferrochelatase
MRGSMNDHPLFPMFLKLTGRRCVVVGAGQLGESKIASLLDAGAEVMVIAPQATSRVQDLAAQGKLRWLNRPFAAGDLDAAFLAVAATASPEIDETIFRECQRRGVLCNTVDDPPHCDFFYGAVVRRGLLQIAISTGGASPALAARLRRELEQQFGPEYEKWLVYVSERRREVLTSKLPPGEKKAKLENLASHASLEQFLSFGGKPEDPVNG